MNTTLIQKTLAALTIAITSPLLAGAAPQKVEQLPRVVISGKAQPAVQQLPRVVVTGHRSIDGTVLALNSATEPVSRHA